MMCNHCHKKITDDTKFCNFCGSKTSAEKSEVIGSVDRYFQMRDNSCEICGSCEPTDYVDLNQNIGMIFMRTSKNIKGKLCKSCITKIFWKFTLTTLFIGWLGVISFVVSIVYIISNLFYYIRGLIRLR